AAHSAGVAKALILMQAISLSNSACRLSGVSSCSAWSRHRPMSLRLDIGRFDDPAPFLDILGQIFGRPFRVALEGLEAGAQQESARFVGGDDAVEPGFEPRQHV